jgi:hypothetical protein
VNNDDLGVVGRANAAKALFIIAKDRVQVIRLTSKAARLSRDPEAADALKKLVNDMVRYCREKESKQCQDAANTQ